MLGSGIFPQLGSRGGRIPVSAAHVAATWLLGTTVYAVAAVLAARAAIRGFDAAAGRPRPSPPHRVALECPAPEAQPAAI